MKCPQECRGCLCHVKTPPCEHCRYHSTAPDMLEADEEKGRMKAFFFPSMVNQVKSVSTGLNDGVCPVCKAKNQIFHQGLDGYYCPLHGLYPRQPII